MRVIAIGDTHGRDIWRQIGSAEMNFDKMIFIGDYFDTKDKIYPDEQIDNFNEIIELKKAFRDKIVLLLGNHDFHYLKNVDETYSGFQYSHRLAIQEVLEIAIKERLLQICDVFQNCLFSHAGFSKTWCATNHLDTNCTSTEFVKNANNLFYTSRQSFKFKMGINRSSTGDDITQSPIWIRPSSLAKDKIDDYVQVVGHTACPNIKIENDIVMIDTLGFSKEYILIQDNQMHIVKMP